MQVIHDAKVDEIILNGDILDMYNVNSHGPTHPIVGTLLEDEIEDTRMWLCELRKHFKKQKITFLFGNHEDRFERFIKNNCPSFFNYLSLESLLNLDSLGISYADYNTRYQVRKSNIYVQHSPPSYAKNGAMTSLEKDVDESTIYGCTHREQKAVKTGKSGKKYYCYFNGWLGSTDRTKAHRKVFSYVKGHEAWQQCFSLIHMESNKNGFIEQISLQNGKACWNGKVYK